MFKKAYTVATLLLLSWVALCAGPIQADQALEIVVYFSPKCSHCTYARENILDPLARAYGGRLALRYVDILQEAGYRELEDTEARLGKNGDALPIIVIGTELISTDDATVLEATLKQLVSARLGEPAGSPKPSAPAATATVAARATLVANATVAAASSTATAAAGAPSIHLAYVQKDGCDKCARAAILLEVLQKEYPALVVKTFNDRTDAKTVEAMGRKLGLPEAQRLVAPAVYVGRDALVGDQVTGAALRPLLDKYRTSGALPVWDGLDVAGAQEGIIARFRQMGLWAVVLAAAVDGINPCAFATLVFFVSYLALSRRPRRELLLVGMAFTLGVFITYLAVGLGAMSLLNLLHERLLIVARWLFVAFGIACLVLAGLSVRDYFLARQGRVTEMTLRLPDKLRERAKRSIRTTSNAGEETMGSLKGLLAYTGLSLVSGAFVSFVELACTGQMYLPTITAVVSIAALRAQAVAYLLLYNVVFVLPLVILLLLVVFGVSAQRFQKALAANVARTKIITAAVFVVLGVLLLTQAIG